MPSPTSTAGNANRYEATHAFHIRNFRSEAGKAKTVLNIRGDEGHDIR